MTADLDNAAFARLSRDNPDGIRLRTQTTGKLTASDANIWIQKEASKCKI